MPEISSVRPGKEMSAASFIPDYFVLTLDVENVPVLVCREGMVGEGQGQQVRDENFQG
jgi:hypothetical protein